MLVISCSMRFRDGGSLRTVPAMRTVPAIHPNSICSRHIPLCPYLFPSQTGRLWARFPCRRESRTLQPGNAISAVSDGCVAVEAAATARRRTGVC
jgi:hypothetical protein